MLELDVFLEGAEAPVGRLVRGDDMAMSFRYLDARAPHPLSLSLPLREAPFGDVAARAFFANLIFENQLREQVIARHGLSASDHVGLLFHLGADCPGGISCVPRGEGPGKRPGRLATDYDALDDAAMVELVRSLVQTGRIPRAMRDPSPIAGVQGKIALARLDDGRFALPRPGEKVPTTHILKTPRPGRRADVDLEHLAMGLMLEVQTHPVAKTDILDFGDERALLVERFDRTVEAGLVRRVHQEDFCQALGLPAELKYQRNGAPPRAFSARGVASVIERTALPGRSRQAIFEITLANLLLGNVDNHAKNHALLYTGPTPILAPVYDVAPALADPEVLHQLALHVGGARMTDEITRAHLDAFARDLGMRGLSAPLRDRSAAMLRLLVGRIDGLQGPRAKRLGDVIAEQARHLIAAVGVDIEVPERDLVVINRPD